jgi:protein-disulfide isomerase
MTALKIPVTDEDHYQGPPDAPLTLVEYGDFECPHCGRAHGVVKRLQQMFGDDLRFVYRHFPLSTIHPNAQIAAEAAEAAGAQGKFWLMHDWLFENQEDLAPPRIAAGGQVLGLDSSRFIDDIKSERYGKKVKDDFMGGVRSGVNGTPTFFINGERHDGRYDFDSLAIALNRVLEQAA